MCWPIRRCVAFRTKDMWGTLQQVCVRCSFADSSFVQLKIGLELYLCHPLSRMSTHVVIQPFGAWSFLKWITSLSFTADCSPLANENLLVHGCVLNQIWSRLGWRWQAWTSRSMAKRDPMARVQPESSMMYVGLEPKSTHSQRRACWAPWS